MPSTHHKGFMVTFRHRTLIRHLYSVSCSFKKGTVWCVVERTKIAQHIMHYKCNVLKILVEQDTPPDQDIPLPWSYSVNIASDRVKYISVLSWPRTKYDLLNFELLLQLFYRVCDPAVEFAPLAYSTIPFSWFLQTTCHGTLPELLTFVISPLFFVCFLIMQYSFPFRIKVFK